ncbi:MAG: DPP IV N-terminal domain-containing protein [Saprospiraceae bacterium]|nr:DPP IV N-terminal domain-containing protein [Saprospiraceae bacterium]
MKHTLGILYFLIGFVIVSQAQPGRGSQWTTDGTGYYQLNGGAITLFDLSKQEEQTIIPTDQLIPSGAEQPLPIRSFSFSDDNQKVLIFTNTKRVWRYDTRGDYWVLDRATGRLYQLGANMPASSLMFAKFSPDGTRAAYVSGNDIYMEDLGSGQIKRLTDNGGNRKLINGTFDWAYEEEFGCRDGFQWSPDGYRIAFWQIDANTIRDFYMINTTDSIYAYTIPVEYPKVGESPSACRVGVVEIGTGQITWMQVPGDNRQHYIPRMEWADPDQLFLQQLNRKQNQSKLMLAAVKTGEVSEVFSEQDEAWISVVSMWENGNGWRWIEDGKAFLWITEQDGWRHIYRIAKTGGIPQLITHGEYDVISPLRVDEAGGYIYFMASPDNATESYLYRTALDGSGTAERISPAEQAGSHSYQVSPNATFAFHTFSNYYTPGMREWISLPDHEALDDDNSIKRNFDPSRKTGSNVSFFTITTDDGVTMDGWMAKPNNFDPSKKYPVLFYVYSEPAGQTVRNRFGTGRNNLYQGDMAADGYVYISLDGRGTPAPKGRAWRKAIYRKIGIVNIRDQAMACKKLLATHAYLDPDRVAVHGWSGGGSATLNLLFQYPELYQTGIAVAAVANQLTYDNIYQERYMGIPQENREDFIQGSPITYAKNLEGNLLYIHGTGDDNVHYQNAEMLVNELIKHNKIFQFMPYPNRSHGIWEGEGTRRHLSTLFTTFLQTHCPMGAQ